MTQSRGCRQHIEHAADVIPGVAKDKIRMRVDRHMKMNTPFV